jgi:hypothetical protein
MNDITTLLELLPQGSTSTTFWSFTLNLIGAGLTSAFLGLFYAKYGTSLSNRKKMATTFSALSMTTMLVIFIIKSNLALSLGLVGALSIVRFRAAIKEPEELVFLFLNISIGIGFGANQGVIVLFAVPFICLSIYIHSIYRDKSGGGATNSLFVTISTSKDRFDLPSIYSLLETHCASVEFKRFNNRNETYEASFIVMFKSLDDLNQFRLSLESTGEQDISIIENTTIFQ